MLFFEWCHCDVIHTGPPSELHPVISYNETGLSLTISWDEPFTHTGFNITEYSVQIVNNSNAAIRTVSMGLSRVFVDSVDAAPSECNELEYTVFAYNSIGTSTASVCGGFPIRKCIIIYYYHEPPFYAYNASIIFIFTQCNVEKLCSYI